MIGIHRSVRAAILTFALFASAMTMSASSSARVDPGLDGCVPEYVPAVGQACRQPDGLLRVAGPDGSFVLTHGADPIPKPIDPTRSDLTSREAYVWPGQVKPKCIKDRRREFYNHVIYARAFDRPDRYVKKLTEIRAMVNIVNGKLREEAESFGRVTDFRFLCTGTNATVSRVVLPTPDRDATFQSIFIDLLVAGLGDSRAKYWVWYDGPPRFGAAGVGTMFGQSAKSAENRSNYGQTWAVTFGQGLLQNGQHTIMHEAGHNLGAVQRDAPHSSLQGHCIDDQDVMCYPEPGNDYAASNFRVNICKTERFDCRFDDYFNPKPRSGTYIATHWNIGSPLNRFISGCQFSTGSIVAPTPTMADDPTVTATRGVTSRCWARSFALSGVAFTAYDALRAQARLATDAVELGLSVANRTMLQQLPADFSVCFYKGSTRQRCHDKTGTEMGTVPWGATKIKIWMTRGVDATYFFNAV